MMIHNRVGTWRNGTESMPPQIKYISHTLLFYHVLVQSLKLRRLTRSPALHASSQYSISVFDQLNSGRIRNLESLYSPENVKSFTRRLVHVALPLMPKDVDNPLSTEVETWEDENDVLSIHYQTPDGWAQEVRICPSRSIGIGFDSRKEGADSTMWRWNRLERRSGANLCVCIKG